MIKIVSKALIKNKNGKYLLLYRGDTHPNFPGHLDLPGGEVESEETSKTATAREVQEETGICIYPNDLKKLFIKQYKNTKHVLFETVIDKTEADISVKLSWEHKKYRWMTLSELLDTNIPEGADPYYIDVIDYLKHLSETWSVRHIFPYYVQGYSIITLAIVDSLNIIIPPVRMTGLDGFIRYIILPICSKRNLPKRKCDKLACRIYWLYFIIFDLKIKLFRKILFNFCR